MVVDWARSCYRGSWRLFANRPDILTPGRFYFAEEDITPYYPGFHNFTNADWTFNAEEPYVPPALGEDRSLRRGYSKGGLGIPRPRAIFLGTEDCLKNGETNYPAPDRLIPGGVDAKCYPAESVPVAPMAGMLFWHIPEELIAGPEGAPVAGWIDASGNRNTLSQLAGLLRPGVTLGLLGGFNAVVFQRDPSVRQTLQWGLQPDLSFLPLNLGNSYAVYVVGTLTGPQGYQTGPSIDGGLGPTRSVLTAADVQTRAFVGTSSVAAATGFAPLEPHIWYCRRTADVLEIGTELGPLTVGNVPAFVPATAGAVGVDTRPGPVGRSTAVSEILGYNRAIDVVNHQGIIYYLRSKFGF